MQNLINATLPLLLRVAQSLLVFASRQDVDHLFGRHQIYASCRVSIIEPPLEVALQWSRLKCDGLFLVFITSNRDNEARKQNTNRIANSSEYPAGICQEHHYCDKA